MRSSTTFLLSWLTIAMALFAIPSLPLLVPQASADLVGPGAADRWRPYGPYVRQVLGTIYANENPELAAFQAGNLDWFDWTIPRAAIPGLIGNPDALVSGPTPEAGKFQIDFNNRYPILGVTMQEPAGPCSSDPASAQFNGAFGPCSSVRPTEAGRQVKKAIAHLIDKQAFINEAPLCAGGFCVPIDDPIPSAVCTDTVAPCTTFSQRVGWEAGMPHAATASCLTAIAGQPCGYHQASGPGGGRPSALDLQAAREHLAAAGLQDSDGDGLFDFPATGQTIWAIRSDDARRLHLGTIMADALDSLFERSPSGQPVVFRLLGGIDALGETVFLSSPDNDFGLYTGGWGLGLDATHFFGLYDSFFGSNFCGGTESLFNLNYGFYCNNAFDVPLEKANFEPGPSLSAFNNFNQIAADVSGNDVMTVEVYSRLGRTLIHNGWTGVVDVRGSGFGNADNTNWLQLRQKTGYVSTGGLGAPGGGNPDLLRAGFRQPTSRLNIFHAGTVWEAFIITAVLDTPGGFSPRPDPAAPGGPNPFFHPFETSVTAVREFFCTSFTACRVAGVVVDPAKANRGEGVPDNTPITVLQFNFRDDLVFHDGVQLTAEDFLKSGLAYRDVPQGGFGGAANWAPLLDFDLPVPNSNCGQFCVQVVMQGQSFLHKLNLLSTLTLPLHLWDTNGDGFICSALGIDSCEGRAADPTTDINYDPMANGIFVGHGPFMCIRASDRHIGGTCTQTAAGAPGGQAIALGGTVLLTRFDDYMYGSPTVSRPGPLASQTPLRKIAAIDFNNDWRVDSTNDLVQARIQDPSNLELHQLIQASLESFPGAFLRIGGTEGLSGFDVDNTDSCNAYAVSSGTGLGTCA